LRSVSLSDARQKAREIIAGLKDPSNPVDPVLQRRNVIAAQKLLLANQMTFKQCAEALIEIKSQEWRNKKSELQWSSTLVAHAYPHFGDLPVADITTAMVVKCLNPIWLKTNETARRLQGRISAVLDWASAHDFRKGENPARWKGHLDKLLADPSKVQKTKHFPALPYTEVGSFMKLLRQCDGTGARALEFTILTAARSGEVRGAEWSEFDLQKAVWVIPAQRMKAAKEHRVPLSNDAVALLESLTVIKDCSYVFPGPRSGTLMSDMTLLAVLRRLNRKDITVHGFRSTFRDWAAECTSFSRDVAEMALAHSISNAVEAAYRRGDLFLKRQQLMTSWSNYCNKTLDSTKSNIVNLHGEVMNAY
jgi:integrase